MASNPSPRLRPLHAAAATLLLIAAVLTACGSGSTGSPSSSQPPATPVVYRWGVVGNAGKIAQLQLATPTAITGITGHVVQIATSNSDGYALTSTGAVYAWGVNSSGELGDGQKTPYETEAAKVEFPVGVKIVSLPNPMPFDAGLAIDSTGHAWGWGLNGSGDLCVPGSTEIRPTELPFSGVILATGADTRAFSNRTALSTPAGVATPVSSATGRCPPRANPSVSSGFQVARR